MSNRIRMRHLRCFLAVARTKSVTRAAEMLGTVQPSISRSLKELETELGSALFDRSSHGLKLTTAGQTLHNYIASGMAQVDRGIETLRGAMENRRVSAYVLPNVVRVIMPNAVRRFKDLYPAVDVHLMPTAGSGLPDPLRDGVADFGFGRLMSVAAMEGMNFEHLYSEPLAFFVRKGHPLVGAQGLSVHDLDAFQAVVPSPNSVIRQELDRFLTRSGLPRFTNRIETISFEFARTYMRETDAVVCQPVGALRAELARGEVAQLDIGGSELMGAVGLTTPAHRPLSASAELLIDLIREEVQAHGLMRAS